MEMLLVKIAGMGVTASYLAVAVLLLHLLLKKAPKSLLCGLWALVGIRLVCPITVESVFSLIPRQTAVPREVLYAPVPSADAIQPSLGLTQGTVPAMSGGTVAAGHPAISLGTVMAVLWLLGVAAMLSYGLVSSLRIRKKVSPALCLKENVYLCDYIDSPFIFGILRPRIYLPSGLDEQTGRYVLAHERAHLSRRDHWWKLLGFILLAVHWFNPVLWLSYRLLCRDIEMACDEKVIRKLGTGARKNYSRALLSCSVPGRILLASPLAFGEVGVKERVKNVLSYKKPTIYVIVLCILVSIIAAGCFMTDPKTEPEPSASQPVESLKTTGEETQEPVKPSQTTEPTADPLDSWEKGMGPYDVDFADVQFRVPEGWHHVSADVYGSVAENPYMEIAPLGIEDCRIRVEVMSDKSYERDFLGDLPENLTASECTLRYYPATMYCPAGSDRWQYIVLPMEFPVKDTYCVVENRFTAEEWETYESGVGEILGAFRAPECELNWDEAVACAKEYFPDCEGYEVTALPDWGDGCWNVTFRKSGVPNEVVTLGICGEFRGHHQENFTHIGDQTHHEEDTHHEENHHSGHH